jgi:hypothetical protein
VRRTDTLRIVTDRRNKASRQPCFTSLWIKLLSQRCGSRHDEPVGSLCNPRPPKHKGSLRGTRRRRLPKPMKHPRWSLLQKETPKKTEKKGAKSSNSVPSAPVSSGEFQAHSTADFHQPMDSEIVRQRQDTLPRSSAAKES